MNEKKLSAPKTIRLKSDEIITDAETLMQKLTEIEEYAKAKKKPFRHYFVFRQDIQDFTDRFKRMQR